MRHLLFGEALSQWKCITRCLVFVFVGEVMTARRRFSLRPPFFRFWIRGFAGKMPVGSLKE